MHFDSVEGTNGISTCSCSGAKGTPEWRVASGKYSVNVIAADPFIDLGNDNSSAGALRPAAPTSIRALLSLLGDKHVAFLEI